MKIQCEKCGNVEFFRVNVQLLQEWEVDENGEWVKDLEVIDVNSPTEQSEFWCMKCDSHEPCLVT